MGTGQPTPYQYETTVPIQPKGWPDPFMPSNTPDPNAIFNIGGSYMYTPQPDPQYILHWIDEGKVNVAQREIYMCIPIESPGDEEGGDWRGWTKAGFRYLDLTPGPITLYINTPGGDEAGMFMLYDLIRTAKNLVVTVGMGEVCSAGVLLLAAGDRRLVTENCVLMSHEGRHSAVDLSASEAKARMKLVEYNEWQWCELMARHTGKAAKEWEKITKKEAELWLLGGQEIVDKGIADVVVPSVKGGLQKAIYDAIDFLQEKANA